MVFKALQEWTNDNPTFGAIIGIAFLIAGLWMLSGQISMPSLSIASTVGLNDASLDADRQESALGSAQLFQTVGTGAEEVTYNIEVTNEADFRQDYKIIADLEVAEVQQGQITASIDGNSQTVSPSDNLLTVESDLSTYDPGETKQFTLSIESSDPQNGDRIGVVIGVHSEDGSLVSGSSRDEILYNAGSVSVALIAAGSVMSLFGVFLTSVALA